MFPNPVNIPVKCTGVTGGNAKLSVLLQNTPVSEKAYRSE